jgi:hypothetical protein
MFRIVNGQLTVTAANAVRRSASSIVAIPYPEDASGLPVPVTRNDLLFPDGSEMGIFGGCVYDDGTTEVVPMGRFLMEDVEVYNTSSSGGLYLQLNGSDRGATIARSLFRQPYSTDGVSPLPSQVQAMLNAQVSNLEWNLSVPSAGWPVPAQANFAIGDDPWAGALTVCADAGFELFPDATGVLQLRPVVDPSNLTPVATYVDDDTSIMTSVQRSLVNTGVPNLIIMVSQGSNIDVPLQSVYWDSDPNSPTFYNATTPPLFPGSPIPENQGTYPATIMSSTSSTATTQADNDAAAKSAFLAAVGSFNGLDWKIRWNPAHDVEDVCTITSQLDGIIQQNYVVDTITFQLSGQSETELKGRLVS